MPSFVKCGGLPKPKWHSKAHAPQTETPPPAPQNKENDEDVERTPKAL